MSEFVAGWYSKTKKPKRKTPRESNNTHRPSTAPTTNTISNDGQIPAIRPLNLASLHDHTTNASASELAIDSGVMFSARSAATTRWAAAAAAAVGGVEPNDWAAIDTPRSWVTAASMAVSLPQSKQEMDAMDIEEVRQLVEDVDVLQQKAKLALKLGHSRLKQNHRRQHLGVFAAFFLVLNMGFVLMTAIMDIGLIALEAIVRLVAGQRRGSNSRTGGVAKIYAAVGAVAGAVQGIIDMSILGSGTSTVN